MAVKITDIEISRDACLDDSPLDLVCANDLFTKDEVSAPLLQFETIDDLIQHIKDNSGVYVGSRSLGVGTEESDYDFIVNSELGESFIRDYELHGYSVDYLSGDYPDCDLEVFGEGFEENFKVYYYDDNKVLYPLNFFMFNNEKTIRKYQVLQNTMLSIPKEEISWKGDRVAHFAHIQYVLGISSNLDIPYNAKLFAEYSGKLAGDIDE